MKNQIATVTGLWFIRLQIPVVPHARQPSFQLMFKMKAATTLRRIPSAMVQNAMMMVLTTPAMTDFEQR
jgi:hypothetical protein